MSAIAPVFDARETQDPEIRENALLRALPLFISQVCAESPGWKSHLADVDGQAVTSRDALAHLPIVRTKDLCALQASEPPLGELIIGEVATLQRLFVSQWPLFGLCGRTTDFWRTAPALFAAGFRPGDVVLNGLSYHLGEFAHLFDGGARRLGCPVIPGGPDPTDTLLAAVRQFDARRYTGSVETLTALLERAADKGGPGNLESAAVLHGPGSGTGQKPTDIHGVSIFEHYGSSAIGTISYETDAREGHVVSEDLILEIVDPRTGLPVNKDRIGEVVVTSFNSDYPMIRFGTGDLSRFVPGASPCGRTNVRIAGWLGSTDGAVQIGGDFVWADDVAQMIEGIEQIERARLIIDSRIGRDIMKLRVSLKDGQTDAPEELLAEIGEKLQTLTGLTGTVDVVPLAELPVEGALIEDLRASPE